MYRLTRSFIILAGALAVGVALSGANGSPAGEAPTVAVIAHRGAHTGAPENTLPAFQAAIDLGVDYVELDLRTTSDGGLIIMHNRTVNGPTNGSGAVKAMTLREVRSLDAGVKYDSSFAGTRVPTADEAFALMRGKVGVYLDVKAAEPESVVALIRRHDMLAQTIVYDDTAALAAMKRIEPRIRAMVPRPPKNLRLIGAVAERLRPAVFGSSHREITREITGACHSVGAMVFVNIMAADGPKGWSRAVACGADGLETNRPAALLDYLRSRKLHR